eukprot:2755157-Amphidinium_carterae.1
MHEVLHAQRTFQNDGPATSDKRAKFCEFLIRPNEIALAALFTVRVVAEVKQQGGSTSRSSSAPPEPPAAAGAPQGRCAGQFQKEQFAATPDIKRQELWPRVAKATAKPSGPPMKQTDAPGGK